MLTILLLNLIHFYNNITIFVLILLKITNLTRILTLGII